MSQKIDQPEETKTEETVQTQSRKQYIIAGAIILVALIIAGTLAWLYTGQITQAKEKVFKAIPLPAALVNMSPVSANTAIERVKLAQQVTQSQGITETLPGNDIFDQLLEVKKIEAAASQRGLTITNEAIDEEYHNIINIYAAGDEAAFQKEIEQSYNMTTDKFKSEVVRQELVQTELMFWYNQQESLNQDLYKKARDLQSRLDNNESFDDLAKQFSEDEATKEFGGDSGTMLYDDLLPEFREALKDSQSGDMKLVASRYGLHIIKVLEINNDGENGAKQIHIQQIYFKPVGFEDWLKQETDNMRVIKFLKF